jgi:hypothetical protein
MMRAQAESLRKQGIEARFVSLGRVGHFIPVETAAQVAELIDWARGDPSLAAAPATAQ